MEGYLGTFPVVIELHPDFKDMTPADWAMRYIHRYGQFDQAHHKAWVLDQVARILLGTPVHVKESRWTNGLVNFSYITGEPSRKYLDWTEEMLERDANGTAEYGYDTGTPP
jgi:hypothetical protein